MITKKEFVDFINSYQAFVKDIEKIEEVISGKKYGLNLFECSWYESVGRMLDIFLETHFTELGCDNIYWWLFEDVDHIITQTLTPNLFEGKSEIEYDVNKVEDLYDYLVKFKKDYIKDA